MRHKCMLCEPSNYSTFSIDIGNDEGISSLSTGPLCFLFHIHKMNRGRVLIRIEINQGRAELKFPSALFCQACAPNLNCWISRHVDVCCTPVPDATHLFRMIPFCCRNRGGLLPELHSQSTILSGLLFCRIESWGSSKPGTIDNCLKDNLWPRVALSYYNHSRRRLSLMQAMKGLEPPEHPGLIFNRTLLASVWVMVYTITLCILSERTLVLVTPFSPGIQFWQAPLLF